MSGNTVALIDNHILGCVSDTNVKCDPGLLDVARPIYTTQSATFVSSQIGTRNTCSDVRSTEP